MNLVSKCIETRGGKPKLSADLQYIKENYYDPVHLAATPLRDKLASSLSWASIEMETAIRNNIICHFFARQYKFLKLEYPGLDSSQLRAIQDEINTTVGDTTEITLPSHISVSVKDDLYSSPEKFLYPMYRMNKKKRSVR